MSQSPTLCSLRTPPRCPIHAPLREVVLIVSRMIKAPYSGSSRSRESVECPDFDVHDFEVLRARKARAVERLARATRAVNQVGVQEYRRVTSAAHAEPARSHLNEMILLGPTVHLHQWRAPCRPTHRQPKAIPTDSLGAALRDVCYTTEEHCMCTPARAAAAGTRSSRRGRSSCSKASTHPARPRRRAVGAQTTAKP